MKRLSSHGGAVALLLTLGCGAQVEIGHGAAGRANGGSASSETPSEGSNATGGTASSNGAAGSNSTAGSNGITGVDNVELPEGTCSHVTKPPPAPPEAGGTRAPCDIYADDGGPCVAAHSTVRALYATYDGPLYQVRRTMDGATHDIVPLGPGATADAEAQDTFCGTDACTISIIYDQSGQGNHLTKAPPGGAKPSEDNEANANGVAATFGGHKVYGVHVVPGVGYRDNSACGTAIADNAETEYAVVAGDFSNNGCCFDYGNMERNSRDNGEGTMEAVYFGGCTIWGKGAGNGPWVMGDLENGLWAGDKSPYDANTPVTFPFVTAMVKGDAAGKNHWTIKTGNAQAGMLMSTFDGVRPSSRYNPMRKEGAIGLGTGGDNSTQGRGNFFEGIMTAHYSSPSADDAVQANIVAFYGKP
jgi:non-reducing end alpha-L-arabinofuranosidase